jgi:hypothetical protein
MVLPVATWKSASLAGASLAGLVSLLSILKSHGLSPFDADSPQVVPFIFVYFFVSMFIFVIGIKSLAPKELRTSVPGVYFPTNKQGIRFLLTVWGRMLVWFLAAASTGAGLALLKHALQ